VAHAASPARELARRRGAAGGAPPPAQRPGPRGPRSGSGLGGGLVGEAILGAVAPLYAVSGHLTHLGRLDEDASLATIHTCEVIMGSAGPEGVTGAVTAHLVGPQGDAVDLAGTLTLIFAAAQSIGDWDIVGGAGRFEGASGYLDTVEHPAEDGIGSVGSGSGMITLPGPMKGGRGPGR
jgi:hypothetical protein